MATLDKIAFLVNYGVEAIRSFISTEDLTTEMLITLAFFAFVIAVL